MNAIDFIMNLNVETEEVVPMKLQWFLRTSGDSSNVTPGADGSVPRASFESPARAPRTAEQAGFDAVVTPVWPHG